MRKLATLVLLLFVASVSLADTPKSKIAGAYRGPSEAYGLIIDVAPDGKLRGNYVELGRVAVLNAIEVNGADFTARASFDNGTLKTIRGSFASRVLNGRTAFGAQMKNVDMEGAGAVDAFFERIE